jgi:hypothetical protein
LEELVRSVRQGVMFCAAAMAAELVVAMFGGCDAVAVLMDKGGELGSGAIGLTMVIHFWCW